MSNDALESLKHIEKCVNPYFLKNIKATKEKTILLTDEKSEQNLLLDFGNLQHTILLSIDKDRDKRSSKSFDGIAPDKLLPFFNPEIPNITEKNDFILLAYHSGSLYVFLIELKRKTKCAYLTQMKAGRCIIEFIVKLLSLHGRFIDTVEPRYFGVLCFSGKKSPDKGDTRHDNNFSFSDRNGLLVSEFKDSSLNLRSLLNAAKRAES